MQHRRLERPDLPPTLVLVKELRTDIVAGVRIIMQLGLIPLS